LSSSFPAARFPTLPLRKDHEASNPPYNDEVALNGELSDEALITRICAEDRDALGHLFRRYARLVHGISRRILRDDAEAQDLVQELFLYVYRKASLYDARRGSVRTWIVQISYYRALVRRSQLASRHYYGCVDPANKEAEELVDRRPPSYHRSGEGLFGRDGWRELRLCLTEEQWETLRLHFYEGYTLAEIATKRNDSIGNVRHHFYRAIDRLRRRLAGRL
jgi:RNA polymerase sigma-70 factor, ECF subfamily